MSTNCVDCVVNKRTGPDLMCDSCRAKRMKPGLYVVRWSTGEVTIADWCVDEFMVPGCETGYAPKHGTILAGPFTAEEIKEGMEYWRQMHSTGHDVEEFYKDE